MEIRGSTNSSQSNQVRGGQALISYRIETNSFYQSVFKITARSLFSIILIIVIAKVIDLQANICNAQCLLVAGEALGSHCLQARNSTGKKHLENFQMARLPLHSQYVPRDSSFQTRFSVSSIHSRSRQNLTMSNQPYDTPTAEPLQTRERAEVDRYRALRDRFQNGPYYAAVNAASTSAKKGTAERAEFDPFNGMPSYSSRYQKRKRTVPKISGREYGESLSSLSSKSLLKVQANA